MLDVVRPVTVRHVRPLEGGEGIDGAGPVARGVHESRSRHRSP